MLRLPGIVAFVVAGFLAGAAAAEDRVALIIGNGGYASVPKLANAVADAKLIARTLRGLNFRVNELFDADQTHMKTAIADFGRGLRASGPDTIGLFYFAGHGVQASGVNYLIPVDGAIRDEADLDLVGVEARWVVRQMETARNVTNIVILDACRDNPFAAAGARGQGLARMDAPTGTFIAYSTAPGSVALDGAAANSPFSAALAASMVQPGQPLEQTFRQVRVNVLRETSGRQTPWDSSSLVREFVFNPAKAPPPDFAEEKAWSIARAAGDRAIIAQFLRDFPKSVHADEAQTLIGTASGKVQAAVGAAPAPPRPDPAPAAQVTFTGPLAGNSPEIAGKSIEQLVHGTPAFAPIEGLPPEAWQGKPCITCHSHGWNRQALCEQGQFYGRSGESRTVSKQHPFGIAFHLALRDWAAGGCQ
jgi:uncharacterized caspase-like protein